MATTIVGKLNKAATQFQAGLKALKVAIGLNPY